MNKVDKSKKEIIIYKIVNLFVSYGMQYMKGFYIIENLKCTQKFKKKKLEGASFCTLTSSIFTLSFLDLGNTLCATDRESFSVASLSIKTDLVAS